MFAIIAGLMAVLVVLGATQNSRFDGDNLEKALVGLLTLPMLAFGNAEFSRGWLIGAASVALIGAVVAAGGMPLLLSILVLQVACAACWDDFRSEEIPAPVIVEEYLDDSDVAEMARRELAKTIAAYAMAKARIASLEAQIAQAYLPSAAELSNENAGLQEIFGLQPLDITDTPYPQWVREPAHA